MTSLRCPSGTSYDPISKKCQPGNVLPVCVRNCPPGVSPGQPFDPSRTGSGGGGTGGVRSAQVPVTPDTQKLAASIECDQYLRSGNKWRLFGDIFGLGGPCKPFIREIWKNPWPTFFKAVSYLCIPLETLANKYADDTSKALIGSLCAAAKSGSKAQLCATFQQFAQLDPGFTFNVGEKSFTAQQVSQLFANLGCTVIGGGNGEGSALGNGNGGSGPGTGPGSSPGDGGGDGISGKQPAGFRLDPALIALLVGFTVLIIVRK